MTRKFILYPFYANQLDMNRITDHICQAVPKSIPIHPVIIRKIKFILYDLMDVVNMINF